MTFKVFHKGVLILKFNYALTIISVKVEIMDLCMRLLISFVYSDLKNNSNFSQYAALHFLKL